MRLLRHLCENWSNLGQVSLNTDVINGAELWPEEILPPSKSANKI